MRPSRLVLLGDPVSHSLSPRFQGAAIKAAGLDLRYDAVRVTANDLADFARQLASENAAGNITVPHKTAFSSLCAERSSIASRAGAVNTFWTRDGRLVGDNTDVGGFDAAVRELLGTEPRSVLVALIGAGGAAAAALTAIEGWPGAKVNVFSRNPNHSARLAERFSDVARVKSSEADALRGATLVVNATPIGMADDACPIDASLLSAGAAVLDFVYKRGGTALTRAAGAAGFTAADGTTMLVEQGAISFERWFGFPPDKGVMRAALG